MGLLLSAQLLSALFLLALSSSSKETPEERFDKFKLQHTYNQPGEFDYCKRCNSVIMGNKFTRPANIRDVRNVCREEGMHKEDNLYWSKKQFYVNRCIWTQNSVYPNCEYRSVTLHRHIILGTSMIKFNPIHFIYKAHFTN
uniref:Ribonuclease A-domain domain-containing protein n=1 Tax=Periophthalmus magnuspinnatus TaxID=409849 RepID=A0A3B3ZLI5_9GOBI